MCEVQQCLRVERVNKNSRTDFLLVIQGQACGGGILDLLCSLTSQVQGRDRALVWPALCRHEQPPGFHVPSQGTHWARALPLQMGLGVNVLLTFEFFTALLRSTVAKNGFWSPSAFFQSLDLSPPASGS